MDKNINITAFSLFFIGLLYIIIINSCDSRSLSDIEGNVYETVVIGEQKWMAENLQTTTYNNGTAIPNVENDSDWEILNKGAYCWYENDAVANEVYGPLYNWYAVKTGKLCPPGWHVPTDEEWTVLTDYLAANGHLDKEGTVLKSTFGWHNDLPGSDDYSFTALPGGYRLSYGTFFSLNGSGRWWSATETTSYTAWYRGMYYNNSGVRRNHHSKKVGMSVRCIKD